jgi:hypothetical protein
LGCYAQIPSSSRLPSFSSLGFRVQGLGCYAQIPSSSRLPSFSCQKPQTPNPRPQNRTSDTIHLTTPLKCMPASLLSAETTARCTKELAEECPPLPRHLRTIKARQEGDRLAPRSRSRSSKDAAAASAHWGCVSVGIITCCVCARARVCVCVEVGGLGVRVQGLSGSEMRIFLVFVVIFFGLWLRVFGWGLGFRLRVWGLGFGVSSPLISPGIAEGRRRR